MLAEHPRVPVARRGEGRSGAGSDGWSGPQPERRHSQIDRLEPRSARRSGPVACQLIGAQNHLLMPRTTSGQRFGHDDRAVLAPEPECLVQSERPCGRVGIHL